MKKTLVFLATLAILVLVGPTMVWSQQLQKHDLNSEFTANRAEYVLAQRGVTSAFFNLFGSLDERQTILAGKICLEFENAQIDSFLQAQRDGLIPAHAVIPMPKMLSVQIIDTAVAIKAAGRDTPNPDLQAAGGADKQLAGSFTRLVLASGETAVTVEYPNDCPGLTFQECMDANEPVAEAADQDLVIIITEPNPFTATTKSSYKLGAYGGTIIRAINGGTGIKWTYLKFQFDHQAIFAKYGKDYSGAVIDPEVNGATFCIAADLGANIIVENVMQANVGATSASQFRFNNVIFTNVNYETQDVRAIDIPQLAAGQVIDFTNVTVSGVNAGDGIAIYDATNDGTFVGDNVRVSGAFNQGFYATCSTYLTKSRFGGNSPGVFVAGDCSDASLVKFYTSNSIFDGNGHGILLFSVSNDPTVGISMPTGDRASIENCRIRSNGTDGIHTDYCANVNLYGNNIAQNLNGISYNSSSGMIHRNIFTQNTYNVAVGSSLADTCVDYGVPNLGDVTFCGWNSITSSPGSTTPTVDGGLIWLDPTGGATLTAHANWWGASARDDLATYFHLGAGSSVELDPATTGNVEVGKGLVSPLMSGAVGELELTKNVDGLNIDIVDLNWTDPPTTAYVRWGNDPSTVRASGTLDPMTNGFLQQLIDGVETLYYVRVDTEPYINPDEATCP
ncbi:right-handed parallel beta-helix repeat-containing protein [Patescibacteria group bacterium]